MRTSQKAAGITTTIGIDIGKNTFHLVGLNKRGAIVLQQKAGRGGAHRIRVGQVDLPIREGEVSACRL